MRIAAVSSPLVLVALLTTPLLLAAQDAPVLSDPEIAHAAVTANAVDVEMAELALSRAGSPDVLSFARTMIADHNAVNGRAADLARRIGVTPEDNALSRSLRTGAEAERADLAPLDGSAFDRAYMERDVGYHEAVLGAIDSILIPQSDNDDLRALLEDVRPAIASHLDHAKQILADLPAGR